MTASQRPRAPSWHGVAGTDTPFSLSGAPSGVPGSRHSVLKMDNSFRLSLSLTVALCDHHGLRFEQLSENLVGGKLTGGHAYVDEDNVLVLVVDPSSTWTRILEVSEVEEWRRIAEELPVWDETSGYRWERAPGPWADPVGDSEEIAVMSAL